MNFPSVPWRILVVSGLLVAALIGLVVREGAARAEGQEVALDRKSTRLNSSHG